MLASEGWKSALVETSQAGLYRAHVRVSARNHAAEIRDIDLGSFAMLGINRQTPAAESPPALAQTPTENEPAPVTGKRTNWRLVGIIVVAVNLFLMLLALIGWLLLRRRKAASAMLLDEEEVSA